MGKMSREKGKRYEREVAGMFKDYGYDASRTAQHCGKTGDAADVEGVPHIHIEAKHQEKIQIYDWMEQAKRDADAEGEGNIPVVIFRRNNHKSLVAMEFDDFMKLYTAYDVDNMPFSKGDMED